MIAVSDPPSTPTSAASRQVVIFFSDIVGFSTFTEKIGDKEAARIANKVLAIQVDIIQRDGEGQVLKFGGDSILAVFDKSSVAMSRSLEIQRSLKEWREREESEISPAVRIGLHMGEVSFQQGDHLEIISRQINRAARMMDAAGDDQILASEVVIEAGRDFVTVPADHLAIEYYGEYYLKGVGATEIYEIADLRYQQPKPPRLPASAKIETALFGSIKSAGYKIAGRIGEGAHGVVYRATHVRTDHEVALKALHPSFWGVEELKKFASEMARLEEMKFPGVIHISDHPLHETPPFFVMDWVDGKPVDTELQFAEFDRIASIFLEITQILERVHKAGMIHGNLKTTNVVLQEGDKPLLLDFGMCYLTEREHGNSPADLVGQPVFLAPEIIQGENRTPQSDIYALGVLLFRTLTWTNPFSGATIHEVLDKTANEDPPFPSMVRSGVPEGLEKICLKAMEKSLGDRYQSATEMAADLDAFLNKKALAIRPTLYDNMLYYRAQRHMQQLEKWTEQGLLSEAEKNQLMENYEPMTRRGWSARFEGRWQFWQLLFLVGGWTMMNLVAFQALTASPPFSEGITKMLLVLPAGVGLLSGLLFWRGKHYRLVSVSSLLFIMSIPFAVGGMMGMTEPPALNLASILQMWSPNQWLMIGGSFLAAAIAGMILTKTKVHSLLAAIAFALFCGAALLALGLWNDYENRAYVNIGWKVMPIMAIGLVVSEWLVRQNRGLQTTPWVAISLASMGVVLFSFSFALGKTLAPQSQEGAVGLLLSAIGIIGAGMSFSLRSHFQHRARPATAVAGFASLCLLMGGLAYAGWNTHWPDAWGRPSILGQAVPVPHLALVPAALLVCFIGYKMQSRIFLGCGLVSVAASMHFLTFTYFHQVAAWMMLSLLAAASFLVLSCLGECRTHQGTSRDDLARNPNAR